MAVTCPDDLIKAIYDLYEGKIADVKILQISEMLERLDRVFKGKSRRYRYHLFKDKAYIYQRYVISPYIDLISIRKRRFNRTILSARVIVEYDFRRT